MLNEKSYAITLRPLERPDLAFVHRLNNNHSVMRYWFEEPYETHDELIQLYSEHVHDLRERRFVVEDKAHEPVGLVELIEINMIHRHGEFQIIIAPQCQGHGYAKQATALAIRYAFNVLNLRKLFLYVDCENEKAIHIYEQCGFKLEAELEEEFFSNGAYRSVKRMCIFNR
jgi:diamine N-acetyltransferase